MMNISYIGSKGFFIPAIIAAVMVTAGCEPASTNNAVDEQRLLQVSRAVQQDANRVSAADLADRLIKNQGNFEVIDLRTDDQFQVGHIQSSSHRAAGELLSGAGIAGLNPAKELVLVSTAGQRAASVATLLSLHGINASWLDGGYAEWLRYTTNPDASPAADAASRARQQAVACYFAGDYVAAAGLVVKSPAGFTPPLVPVSTAPTEPVDGVDDPLGLGLGLGGDDTLAGDALNEPVEAVADPLGLGLGLGGDNDPAGANTSAPAGLILGEGC